MKNITDWFINLDNLWPHHWQHFTLGCLTGALIGLIWLAWAFKTGRIKTWTSEFSAKNIIYTQILHSGRVTREHGANGRWQMMGKSLKSYLMDFPIEVVGIVTIVVFANTIVQEILTLNRGLDILIRAARKFIGGTYWGHLRESMMKLTLLTRLRLFGMRVDSTVKRSYRFLTFGCHLIL